jgi:hypothetical protein
MGPRLHDRSCGWRLRYWLCDQVEAQCAGGRPQARKPLDAIATQDLPVPVDVVAARPGMGRLGGDRKRPSVGCRQRHHHDHRSQPAAAGLLGYGSADQPIGRRLIAVIPTGPGKRIWRRSRSICC